MTNPDFRKMDEQINDARPFQILVLSGGGIRGVYTAAVLKCLEAKAGKPLARCFDLIAGTSIGGILSLGLAMETPAERLLNAFATHGSRIFSKRPAPRNSVEWLLDLSKALCRPKYSDRGLKRAIGEFIPHGTRIEHLKHRVMVPAVNVSTGSPKVFKTPHHQSFETDWRYSVQEVALATSAAPTYFPLARVGPALYADGGLFANAPAIHAYHEANVFLGVQPGRINVLHVGTTRNAAGVATSAARNFGLWQWMRAGKLLSVLYAAQEQCDCFMLQHLLRSRYYRIDSELSPDQHKQMALDVATDGVVAALTAIGERAGQCAAGSPEMQRLLQHSASPPIFYYGVNRTVL